MAGPYSQELTGGRTIDAQRSAGHLHAGRHDVERDVRRVDDPLVGRCVVAVAASAMVAQPDCIASVTRPCLFLQLACIAVLPDLDIAA